MMIQRAGVDRAAVDVPALHAALPEITWTRYADVVALPPWSTLL